MKLRLQPNYRQRCRRRANVAVAVVRVAAVLLLVCCCCCCWCVGKNKKKRKNGWRYEEHNGISSAGKREKCQATPAGTILIQNVGIHTEK